MASRSGDIMASNASGIVIDSPQEDLVVNENNNTNSGTNTTTTLSKSVNYRKEKSSSPLQTGASFRARNINQVHITQAELDRQHQLAKLQEGPIVVQMNDNDKHEHPFAQQSSSAHP